MSRTLSILDQREQCLLQKCDILCCNRSREDGARKPAFFQCAAQQTSRSPKGLFSPLENTQMKTALGTVVYAHGGTVECGFPPHTASPPTRSHLIVEEIFLTFSSLFLDSFLTSKALSEIERLVFPEILLIDVLKKVK